MPVVSLPAWAIVLANVAFWGTVHTGTGYLVHRLPVGRLGDARLFRPRPFEGGARLYEQMHIRRWKDRVPEAGAAFAGGVSKRHLPRRSEGGIERFVIETRRAELGHWLALAAAPASAAWNPPVGAMAMVTYGMIANLPFIAIQRFNRQRAQRVLDRSSGSRSEGPRRR